VEPKDIYIFAMTISFFTKLVGTCSFKEKLHLPLLNFGHFLNILPMFKTSHLGVSKFGFLSLCSFRTENPNGMPILPLTPKLKLRHFGNGVVLESG
jgi:hypothetical protein